MHPGKHTHILALWLLLAAEASSVSYATAARGDATNAPTAATALRRSRHAKTRRTGTNSRQQPQTQADPLYANVQAWLAAYTLACTAPAEVCRLESVAIDDENEVVRIFTNASFASQPITRPTVDDAYAQLRQLLPATCRDYRIMLFANRQLIDDLVPMGKDSESEPLRQWHDTGHGGNAWVTPLDRPYAVDDGLEGRHISLWASHGRYYSQQDAKWMWQRPSLYCTNEDLFSQTFVVPLLIPMLENAGAVVFTPRERDWQRREAVVDNDTPEAGGTYTEHNGAARWATCGTGFAHLKATYTDFDNPFLDGTARMAEATHRRSKPATATWTPAIPAGGRYAVYVSYATLPTSVPDATYVVCHRGVATRFRVNQQMGGATWVYLGTFDFAAGDPAHNYVQLTNHSNYRGHVTADGVRFGGGMGNIARGDSTNVATSGLPRCLEGARYAAQWAGMSPSIFAGKGGINDYAEDINVRSYMTNYLAGGSAYVPQDSGLHVPIELSLALHTDAGITADSSAIGSLAIYTTDHNEGRLRAGMSRLASRDLADAILTQLNADISATCGSWTRRSLWDRNYSETREPEVPAAIVEMLSHQNFTDMCRAHDPLFKFTVARAIYKATLRYIHAAHGDAHPVVQPLPVTALMARATTRNDGDASIYLSWQPTADPLEPTAKATEYVVYHAAGDGGFDNGTTTTHTTLRIDGAPRGVVHRFRVTAANAGGQSMPSQEVCAYLAAERRAPAILVVDAFDRLAAPQVVRGDTATGFDMNLDAGVPLGSMPAFCGRQQFFRSTTAAREGFGALGYSGSELEGIFVAGNTLDWASRHAADIVRATQGRANISSCTAAALATGSFDSRPYALMDIAAGAQRADGYSLRQAKLFTEPLRSALAEYTRNGGSVMLSGAYVATDMLSADERLFTRQVLRYEYAGTVATESLTAIEGMGLQPQLPSTPNEDIYCVRTADCLAPAPSTPQGATPDAFCAMTYAPTSQSAAVAYQGNTYRTLTLGFPIEAVTDSDVRTRLWQAILQFLLPR